jgi:hypothetical protein
MIYYDVDSVKIPFDKTWNNIAISLSGGADSALLAALLLDLIYQTKSNITVHIISHTRMWKTRPWQGYDSKRVYNYLVNKYPDITFVRHTGFIAPEIEYGNIGPNLTDEYGKKVSGDNIQQRAYAEYICYENNVDAYYNGVTRNPRLAAFNGMQERDLDPTDDNQHLYIMKHMNRYAVHPFRFVSKDWVVRQYRRLDLWDLFEITRSCEGEFESVNYMNYTPGQYVPICGKCFWCKEREWAIDQSK